MKLPPTALNILSKVIWFICTGRNAIIVILCLVLAAIIDPAGISCKDDPENCVFTLTGQIESGLPSFQAPPFGIFGSNETSTEDDTDLSGMISQLGSAIIIIPLIAILESVAIAKAFGETKQIFSETVPYYYSFSWWKACGCQPRNDSPRSLQFIWLFCPVHANNWVI